MMRKCLALFLVLLIAHPTFAATKFMSPTGSDAAAGTTSAPWKTFAASINKLSPGDELVLKNGTYTNGDSGLLDADCDLGRGVDGTSTARITIRAENERQARVNGYVSGKNTGKVWNCDYWSIKGIVWAKQHFLIDGTNSTAVNFDCKFSTNLTLEGNVFLGVSGGTDPLDNGTVTIRDGCDNAYVTENEFYRSERELLIFKYNQGGVVERNYFDSRNAPFESGSGGGGLNLYPAQNTKVNNNIAIYPGHGAGFQCASYLRSNNEHCLNNKWYGNMVYNSLGGFISRTSEPDNDDNPDAVPLNQTVEHMLVIGDNSQSAGILCKSTENCIIKRSTVMFTGTGKPAFYTASVSAMNQALVNLTWTGLDLLAVNNAGRPLLIDTSTDTWSMTNLWYFNNGQLPSAVGNGNCTNCVNSITSDPNIGTKRVWLNLNVGAEILKKYENDQLTNKNLWVPTAPTGYTGTAYPYYFSGCRTVTTLADNTNPDISCAGAANKFNVTPANLPSCY